MIIGLGTDIVAIHRFVNIEKKYGAQIAKRILHPQEYLIYSGLTQGSRFLAKKFAAKEAALKALGTGLRNGIRWQDMHVTHDKFGKPKLIFSGAALVLRNKLGIRSALISISDEREYAVATVIISK